MKQIIPTMLLCLFVCSTKAQKINNEFNNVSLSNALMTIDKESKSYHINFIFDELEDFTVTTNIQRKSIPDAVRQVIGLYPIKITFDENKNIFVECTQKSDTKLIGKLVDEHGQPVIFANIALLNPNDSTFITGGVSNEAGDFVIPSHAQYVNMRITCIGYKTVYRGTNICNMGTIRMRTTTQVLKDIVVNGDNRIRSLDKMTYLPTRRQANAANSGIGLLYNLMIPQLKVNRMDNTISTIDNKNILLCIDGRKVDINEINRIRPRDVLRVEYTDYPTTGVYAGERAVLDYIMRKYDTGGYVDIRTDTRAIYSNGEYTAQMSIDKKKMNYTMLVGTKYVNDDKVGQEKTEDFNFNNSPFERTSTLEYGKMKDRQHYGLFGASYNTDSLNINATLGFVWDENPNTHSSSSLIYSPAVTNPSVSSTYIYQRSAKPYTRLFVSRTFRNNQVAQAYINYSYSRNAYRRTYSYAADATPITSDNSEQYHYINAGITYKIPLKHDNGLKFDLIEYYKRSIGDYSGTNTSHQNLSMSETLPFVTYTQRFAKRLSLMGRLGCDYTSYSLNDESAKTVFNMRANIRLNYTINDKSSFSLGSDYGNSFPQLSNTSSAEQRIDQYLVMRGNPNLKIPKFWLADANYGLNLKNWNAQIYANLWNIFDNPADYYTEEGGDMIHTYFNNCNIHYVGGGISNTLFLLNKSIQVQTELEYSKTLDTGAYNDNISQICYAVNIMYMKGDFSVSAFYRSANKTLYNSPLYFIKTKSDYGLSATYGHRGWYAEIGCRRIFDTRSYQESWYDYGIYRFSTKDYSDAYGRMVYAKLSYSFDFGRKIKRNDAKVDKTNNSGILHP